MSGAAFHKGVSRQDYATPPDFMAAVRKRFGPISWDLAATADNQQCDVPGRFFCEDENSLILPWCQIAGNLWLNPPFNHIEPWAKKCAVKGALGAKILFLIPASVDSVWFAFHIDRKAHVMFLRPRLSFDGRQPYPKGCMLCAFGFGISGYECWAWK